MTIETNEDQTLFWLVCQSCGRASEVPAPTADRAIAAATVLYQNHRWHVRGDYHLCSQCAKRINLLTTP